MVHAPAKNDYNDFSPAGEKLCEACRSRCPHRPELKTKTQKEAAARFDTPPLCTLIKIIYDELKGRTDINVGYMPQNYDDILSKYKTVLDFICNSGNKEEITKARMFLGNMKFTRDEMTGNIKDLSNGTKAKLFLIKLVLDKCNVLILDEPTRNVSPLSNPVIRKVLKEFGGTIISVSHDRKYLDEVIDTLYILTEDGLVKRD